MLYLLFFPRALVPSRTVDGDHKLELRPIPLCRSGLNSAVTSIRLITSVSYL